MNIALICAYPAGSNHGMLSVDLAFESIKSELDPNINVERFCSWRSLSHNSAVGNLCYTHLYSIEQLEQFDKIIYWGDFLHWIEYGKTDWVGKTLDRDPTMDAEQALDLWYQLFLLENRIDLQQKTIVFGSTLYGLNSRQLLDQRYTSALTSLYSNVRLAMHRDIYSQNFLQQLSLNNCVKFGVDCSLLLDLKSKFAPDYVKQPYFVYSFGRSGEDELLTKVVKDISADLSLEPVKIKWLEKGAGLESLFTNLMLISRARFVLTDIYHCSLNSIREHTPTICFGNGADNITGTLSDKKKEIFFHQHFLNNHYIYIESLKNNYKREINNIVRRLVSSEFEQFRHLLENHIQQVRTTLIKEINKNEIIRNTSK
jgi:hypothetical protein